MGLSLAKAARKAGKISAKLGASVGRLMRGVVDWGRLETAIKGGSILRPAPVIRTARDAIKVERAGVMLHLARDVGRIEAKTVPPRVRWLASCSEPARDVADR